jgi:hypothetical protein
MILLSLAITVCAFATLLFVFLALSKSLFCFEFSAKQEKMDETRLFWGRPPVGFHHLPAFIFFLLLVVVLNFGLL